MGASRFDVPTACDPSTVGFRQWSIRGRWTSQSDSNSSGRVPNWKPMASEPEVWRVMSSFWHISHDASFLWIVQSCVYSQNQRWDLTYIQRFNLRWHWACNVHAVTEVAVHTLKIDIIGRNLINVQFVIEVWKFSQINSGQTVLMHWTFFYHGRSLRVYLRRFQTVFIFVKHSRGCQGRSGAPAASYTRVRNSLFFCEFRLCCNFYVTCHPNYQSNANNSTTLRLIKSVSGSN